MPQTPPEMQAFFDARAAGWDAQCRHDPRKLAAIVTLAGVREGARVLDVACGTGALIGELLARSPAEVVGLDLSPRMIEVARRKFSDARLRLLSRDLFDFDEGGFDVATVYSAYPHFPDKPLLAARLSRLLAPGGRVMIAHSEGRGAINGRHEGAASAVSTPLRPAAEEAEALRAHFDIDVLADTPGYYLLSGVRRP